MNDDDGYGNHFSVLKLALYEIQEGGGPGLDNTCMYARRAENRSERRAKFAKAATFRSCCPQRPAPLTEAVRVDVPRRGSQHPHLCYL